MKSTVSRLDRFISKNSSYKLKEVRLLVAQKRILINNEPAHSVQQQVTQFCHVLLDEQCLQNNKPVYIMLNKPKGYVSATIDDKNPTVIDLLEHPRKEELHIVGRLDLNTTGLVLLTNDGTWSRKVSLPETKLAKTYEVTLAEPLDESYIEAFRQGIYFAFENITTQPADLEVLTPTTARLTITEGKYHQVKRMFANLGNKVLSLHRSSVGHLTLDGLTEGQSRKLTAEEVAF